MQLSDLLKKIRVSRGMTQRDIAAGTDVSASYFSLLETNLRDPSRKTLEKIAGFFNVSADGLAFFSHDVPAEFDDEGKKQYLELKKKLIEKFFEV